MIPAPPAVEPALQVSGAWRRLGDRDVLADVSLTVPRGAVVLLAGANGAGKSSLLRAVGGRLALHRGTIRIAGIEAAAARRAGHLGVVPQDIALAGQLSVRENLRLWGTLAGTPPRRLAARIDEGLAWTGLSDRASWRLDRLSGGMRRRVNLLAGLLHQPALLVLDEPTVGIDRDARQLVYSLLADLRRRDVGVLLVTHDLDDAAGACDAVVVLERGVVVTAAPIAALVAASSAGGELVVAVHGDDASALTADGFAPAGDGTWVRADVAAPDLAAVERHLVARGLQVVELRWRRPTLSGAVARVIARHQGRPS